ncbi:replication-relaxation family protein [Streptomyces albipurpureus]|uniref:Replication-relaxation family protein n=1 Tax=Streptomyces albipurpureus TaxID=2897419 RepID=A0ABT0UHK2_9ACTN|nr:replication-relaxation family protein [Streptomyces sp. CWNU-1]MCM2388123.1 replication-relaxation family protein [Streptomyces sp. CWNU-1]
MSITAAHTTRQGVSGEVDTSLPSPETSVKGKRSTPTAGKVRADALRMLGCVRIATVRQMAQVITAEGRDGRSYVRRAMKRLAETNGKDGRHPIWNLTVPGQKALADGNELPHRPKAGTGAKAVRAGFGPHGIAVTDTILAYGNRHLLTDWQVEVNHAIKETGLSFNTDAVLAVPTESNEVRLFELDNGTMSRARLAREVWDYERYAGHRVWEGARGTNGRTYSFWQRHRYTRSQTFPRLHVVLAGMEEHLLDNRLQALAADVKGIAVAVLVNTLTRLQRGEPWYEIGVDDPYARRERYPEPPGR